MSIAVSIAISQYVIQAIKLLVMQASVWKIPKLQTLAGKIQQSLGEIHACMPKCQSILPIDHMSRILCIKPYKFVH